MGKKFKKMQIEITRLNRIVVDLVLQQQVILKSEVYLLYRLLESFSSSKAPHQQLVNDLKFGKIHQQKLSLSLSRTAPSPST